MQFMTKLHGFKTARYRRSTAYNTSVGEKGRERWIHFSFCPHISGARDGNRGESTIFIPEEGSLPAIAL